MIPIQERASRRGMVATVDHLASNAGVQILQSGGTAADAAIAASAVLAVTTQHMCGMGGDLFAIVHHGPAVPSALNASGRAGSGASAAAMRAAGHVRMPFRGDIRTVTVPGCVDGWLALHERFGRLILDRVFAPAIDLAESGFPPSPTLQSVRTAMASCPGGSDYAGESALISRPRLGALFRDLCASGRGAFYRGRFAAGLLELGAGLYDADDLAEQHADWVDALGKPAFGHHLWTVPPNSQGYAALAAASIANLLPVPDHPDDPAWAHYLVEAARAAVYDRPAVLHDGADGDALVAEDRLRERAHAIGPWAPADWGVETWDAGGTMSLSVVDEERMAVTLIQSNASGYGSGLVEPNTGVFLHNRGIGFSLQEGHVAELAPRRRPPHTLSPLVVTDRDGAAVMAIGTRGADSQPQILLQLLHRLLVVGEAPGAAVAAGRFTLVPREGGNAFDTWTAGATAVRLEGQCAPAWRDGLVARGHHVSESPAFARSAGDAHLVMISGDVLTGAADPRSRWGSAAGY